MIRNYSTMELIVFSLLTYNIYTISYIGPLLLGILLSLFLFYKIIYTIVLNNKDYIFDFIKFQANKYITEKLRRQYSANLNDKDTPSTPDQTNNINKSKQIDELNKQDKQVNNFDEPTKNTININIPHPPTNNTSTTSPDHKNNVNTTKDNTSNDSNISTPINDSNISTPINTTNTTNTINVYKLSVIDRELLIKRLYKFGCDKFYDMIRLDPSILSLESLRIIYIAKRLDAFVYKFDFGETKWSIKAIRKEINKICYYRLSRILNCSLKEAMNIITMKNESDHDYIKYLFEICNVEIIDSNNNNINNINNNNINNYSNNMDHYMIYQNPNNSNHQWIKFYI